MIIYLDWNAMSLLKPEMTEEGKMLNEKLKAIPDLRIPYSPVHLFDLIKAWDTSKENNKKINADVRFIGKISKNLMLIFRSDLNKTVLVRQNPKTYFETLRKDQNLSIKELLDRQIFENPELQEVLRPLLRKMALLYRKSELYQLFEDIQPEPGQEFLKELLPKKDQSLREFFENFIAYLDNMKSNYSVYEHLRSVMQTGLNLNPKIVTNWKNPYLKLSEELPKSVLAKSLPEFLAQINPNAKDLVNEYDTFVSRYIQLDMFAFAPDKLSEKNTFINITNDSQHAYFGAQCDYFLTKDGKTYSKTKAAYEYFGIKTEVLKVKDFLLLPTPT